MKKISLAIKAAVLVVALFFSADTVSAYYDPGMQRWLNRDPLGELASRDLYEFVYNDPIGGIDFYGFWATGDKADPGKNTIVCDGKGGIRV
jgi:hypothetical protein